MTGLMDIEQLLAELPKDGQRTRDVSKLGHQGTGDLELTIRSVADLEELKPLMLRSYEQG